MLKLKNLKKVPDNAILVTADVIGLYPSIQHKEDLEILTKHSLIIVMKNQYLLKIWLKRLNLFLKTTCETMWNIICLEQLLVRNLLHHMRVYIWTTWRISLSKMNKFSLGSGSGTVMIFFSFGQLVKKTWWFFGTTQQFSS